MHAHLCYDCSQIIDEQDFDCALDADHDFALCDRCAERDRTLQEEEEIALLDS